MAQLLLYNNALFEHFHSFYVHVRVCTYVRLYQTEQQEYVEEMEPFSEDDLSLLYPNAQLDNQSILVDAFIRVRKFNVVF